MDIRNPNELKSFASHRVEAAQNQKKIVLTYAGLLTAMAVLLSLIQYVLDVQIGKTGGLSSMGLRSILSTVKTLLPFLQSLIATCLSIGYLASALRMARGQYVSSEQLRLGFDRFWVLLRKTLLEGLIYLGAGIASMYISMFFYLVTPLSNGLMEFLTPMLGDTGNLNPMGLLADAQIYDQLVGAMLPFFILFLVVFCLVVIPIAFRYRMADYVLIDHPEKGAFAILRESRMMMRRNCLNLFRVDLSLWWYYAAVVVVTIIGYGDMLLPLIGVTFPWSDSTVFYLFLALYQLLQFTLCVSLRNRVEATYALSYDAIRPQEPKNGVVLGSIFQM